MTYSKNRDCLICGSNEYKEYVKLDEYVIVKCDKCGFKWANPFFDHKDREKIYKEYCNGIYGDDDKKIDRIKQYKNDIRFIDLCTNGCYSSILDYGCSNGMFLDLFKDCDKIGFDVDAKAIADGKNKHKNIRFYKNKDFKGFKEKVDLIVLRGVIQHFLDPVVEMEKISSCVNDNKYLFIGSLPNSNSFSEYVYHEKWPLYEKLFLSYFNEKNIVEFVGKFGFEMIYKEFPYVSTPYRNDDDYNKIQNFIKYGSFFPHAFWGNMINLVFIKK